MNRETTASSITKSLGLARFCLLLLVSILGIAGFWHVTYGVSLVTAIVVVGEVLLLLALAFYCAWRWSR